MRWNGRTVIVLASGPSLTAEDVRYIACHRDWVHHRIIAVNESWRMVPRSGDVLYGADSAWWLNRAPKPSEFDGELWTQDKQWTGLTKPPGLQTIESRHGCGVAPPGSDFIYQGHNSGFQAMALAVVWGASRIVFLGLDLCAPDGAPNHWHEDYPQPLRNSRIAYESFRAAFDTATPQLQRLGVEVINATPASALKCFPRMTVQEALP